MASTPSTGFQYAPVASDDVGRRFERNIIPTPLGVGFDASVADASQTGPASNVLAGGKLALAQLAGDPVTQEALIDQRKQKLAQVNDLLDRLPGGFISGATAFAGQALGFAADPLNVAATIAAPELIGDQVGATSNALAERATANSTIARATAGGLTAAAEGAAVMAPGALTHLAISDPYKEDFNSLDAFSQIGVGAALGGALGAAGSLFKAAAHAPIGLRSIPPVMKKMIQPIAERIGAGFGGTLKMSKEDVVKPFDQQGARQAQQTAAAQLAQGKQVDVGDILKNSFNEAQDLESEPPLDVSSGSPVESPNRPSLQKAEQARQDAIEESVAANNDFELSVKDLNKKLAKSKAPEDGPLEDLDTKTLIERAGSTIQKTTQDGFGELNDYEKDFLSRAPKTPDIQQSIKVLKKDPQLYTQDDSDFISNITNHEEPRLKLQQQDKKAELKGLQERLSKIKDPEKAEFVKNKIARRQDELDQMNKRLESLKNVKKGKKTPIEKEMQIVEGENLRRMQADKDLKDTMVAQMVLETPHQPITASDVRATAEKMMSPESDMEPPTDQEAFPGSEKQIPDEVGLLKEDEDLYKQLQDAGELTDAEIDEFNAVQEELNNQEGYTKLIKDTAQCLRGSL